MAGVALGGHGGLGGLYQDAPQNLRKRGARASLGLRHVAGQQVCVQHRLLRFVIVPRPPRRHGARRRHRWPRALSPACAPARYRKRHHPLLKRPRCELGFTAARIQLEVAAQRLQTSRPGVDLQASQAIRFPNESCSRAPFARDKFQRNPAVGARVLLSGWWPYRW